MAKCSSSRSCETNEKNINITKNRFKIENLQFPLHNLFYKCNASNYYGNDSKTFQLQVYGNLKRVILNSLFFIL